MWVLWGILRNSSGTYKHYTLSTFLHNISSIQMHMSWTILQRLIAPRGEQQLHQSLLGLRMNPMQQYHLLSP